MKKYIVKMVALCSTIFLSLASQTNNIWAGESYKINNTVAKNYEVKYENITKLDLKTEKQLSNNKIKGLFDRTGKNSKFRSGSGGR